LFTATEIRTIAAMNRIQPQICRRGSAKKQGLLLWLAATVVIAVTVGPSAPAEAQGFLSGTGTAREGDLLSVGGSMVRLSGIDAPDPGQTCRTYRRVEYDCAEMARTQLQSMLDLSAVECRLDQNSTRKPQQIGVCKVLGKDLGAAMIVRGWAFAYRRLNPDYYALESNAQARKAGFWAGRVEAPWLWRDRKINQK
jgi:endonuclease YncB( thermonuclease family)